MESSKSNGILPSSLRQLMSLDSPKVKLEKSALSYIIKQEGWRKGHPPSSALSVNKKPKTYKKSKTKPRSFLCSLCIHPTGDESGSLLCDSSETSWMTHLRFLLGTDDDEDDVDLVFCHVCRHAVTTLFTLREQMSDMEGRIQFVLKAKDELYKIPLSSSFAASCHQLLSLDTPRGTMEKRNTLITVKQEKLTFQSPVPFVQVKRETDTPNMKLYSCSLCTSYSSDLSLFSSPDPRHVQQMASLFRTRDGGDLIFCSICRCAVTRLFKLRDDVSIMEIRIRNVVTLREKVKMLRVPRGTFKCNICGKGFRTTDGRSKHMDWDHSAKNFKCHLCEKVLFSRSGYYSHMRASHKAKKVDSSTLPPITRRRKDGRTLYGCPKCSSAYPLRKTVVGHLQVVHLIDISTSVNICRICNRNFVSKKMFQAHTHPDVNDSSVVVFPCHICKKHLSRGDQLARHINEVHNKVCSAACGKCGKTYARAGNLLAHMKSCSLSQREERKCSFELCGKTFATLTERLNHERVVHEGLRTRKCYFCPKVFRSTDSLWNHMRGTHTCERTLSCDKCGKDFARNDSFKAHCVLVCGPDEKMKETARRRQTEKARIYRAKLNFPCDLCNKRFSVRSLLTRHKDRNH